MPDVAPIKVEARPGEARVTSEPIGDRGIALYRFPWIQDPRGDLTVGEFGKGFPFQPKRYFIVFGASAGTVRGEHAHRNCHQLLICAQGSCKALVDDGVIRREVCLDHPSVGIYMPPMIWGTQSEYSADAALMVLASHYYDPDDYIRDYAVFRDSVRAVR